MKLRATKKMPRGGLNRYRTRMLTADTFVETSPKWSRFYVKPGWATEVVAEPEPAPGRRGRSGKAEVEAPAEEAAPVAEEQEVESNDEPPASEEPEPEPQ